MNTTITLFGLPFSYMVLSTYLLLFFAIFALITKQHNKEKIALFIALSSVLMALIAQLIEFIALIPIGLLALSIFIHHYKPQWRKANWLLLFILSIALMLHLAPGFNNPKLLDQVQLTETSIAYSMYLNFDKAILAFTLLFLLPKTKNAFNYQGLLLVMTAITVLTFTLAILLGVIAWSPKLPSFVIIWLFNNILISCAAEEAFFRGLMQRPLQTQCQQHGISPLWAVACVAILFGFAHLGGGLAYVLLATVIGFGYGYSYYLTGQLRYAIGFHASFNLIHILLFSYPMLA